MEPASFEYINTFANKADDPVNPKKRSREEAFPASRFLCDCEAEPVADLKEHRRRCEKMAEKYGPLFDGWEAAVARAVDDADEWKNMRALYEHFRGRFLDTLEGNLKRRKLNALEPPAEPEGKQILIPSTLGKTSSVPKPAEEFEGFKCLACERVFKDFARMEQELVFIEQCSQDRKSVV